MLQDFPYYLSCCGYCGVVGDDYAEHTRGDCQDPQGQCQLPEGVIISATQNLPKVGGGPYGNNTWG